jgi:hypothetical protein
MKLEYEAQSKAPVLSGDGAEAAGCSSGTLSW